MGQSFSRINSLWGKMFYTRVHQVLWPQHFLRDFKGIIWNSKELYCPNIQINISIHSCGLEALWFKSVFWTVPDFFRGKCTYEALQYICNLWNDVQTDVKEINWLLHHANYYKYSYMPSTHILHIPMSMRFSTLQFKFITHATSRPLSHDL